MHLTVQSEVTLPATADTINRAIYNHSTTHIKSAPRTTTKPYTSLAATDAQFAACHLSISIYWRAL